MAYSEAFPTEEEIWVRRDFFRRGKPFFIREVFAAFWIFFLAGELILPGSDNVLRLNLYTLFSGNINWVAWLESLPRNWGFNALVIVLPLFILTSPAWIFCIKRSSFCPTWFYGEQINPVQLRIFHLFRAPTTLHLKGAMLETESYFQWYTKIRICDQSNTCKIKLSFLTPEEYDRFMQYWNAANPQDKEPNTSAS